VRLSAILSAQSAYRKHARRGENALVLNEYSPRGWPGWRSKPWTMASCASGGEENPRRMAREEDWRINALQMEGAYGAAVEFWRRRGEARTSRWRDELACNGEV